MALIWYIIIPCFVVFFGVLAYLDHKNTKISENIVRVKTALLSKADFGDEFASLFRFYSPDDDINLHVRYSFAKRFGYEEKLKIGPSLKKFWEDYEREEKLYKQDPKHKIYRLFVLNIGEHGNLEEHDGVVDLTIQKHLPGGYNWIRHGTSTSLPIGYYGYYAGGSGGGGGSYKFSYVDDRDIGKLLCPAFEKMRTLWENIEETDGNFTFVIKDEEVDAFCDVCEFVCGDDISW